MEHAFLRPYVSRRATPFKSDFGLSGVARREHRLARNSCSMWNLGLRGGNRGAQGTLAVRSAHTLSRCNLQRLASDSRQYQATKIDIKRDSAAGLEVSCRIHFAVSCPQGSYFKGNVGAPVSRLENRYRGFNHRFEPDVSAGVLRNKIVR